MHWNSENFSEYGNTPNEADYADPTYYQQAAPPKPRSAQPVQPLELPESYPDPDTYPAYGNGPIYESSHAPQMMQEYRGPSNIEGYTVDAGAEQRDAAERGSAEGSKRRGGLAGLGGIGALVAALLKFQWLGFLLKFGWAGLSAIFSIAVYSLIFGWQFAVGLVALLFIHEMGHAIVMKLKGIPVGGMIFIPLMGAAVLMNRMPKNARDEAEVGIAGPIAGAIASSMCLALAIVYPGTLWAPLAYFGFFINLFNLIPTVPFDGGRILAAIDRRIWIIGFVGLVAFQIWSWFNGSTNFFLLLFIILAASQLWSRRRVPNTPEAQAYYAVPVGERIVLALAYFGLAAILVLGMTISHAMILGPVQ